MNSFRPRIGPQAHENRAKSENISVIGGWSSSRKPSSEWANSREGSAGFSGGNSGAKESSGWSRNGFFAPGANTAFERRNVAQNNWQSHSWQNNNATDAQPSQQPPFVSNHSQGFHRKPSTHTPVYPDAHSAFSQPQPTNDFCNNGFSKSSSNWAPHTPHQQDSRPPWPDRQRYRRNNASKQPIHQVLLVPACLF